MYIRVIQIILHVFMTPGSSRVNKQYAVCDMAPKAIGNIHRR